MRVLMIANAEQEKEIRSKKTGDKAELIFKNSFAELKEFKNYDVFFILSEESDFIDFYDFESKPVFINSVVETLSQLKLPKNISRINAWPGFLQRELWEIASESKEEAQNVFNQLGWKIIFVKDEPGFVAARVISMIINEAFFALDEKVSTVEEIDLAMKLGTNYPYGPFEWTEKIGSKNLLNLLNKLSEKETRYLPSSGLKNFFYINESE
ncbi:MAG: 3-hydroxyacyl-CoA dehydrogenase family protein [Bacteroidota bacterium]|nr:3-hydroxyacyl-CoA dehydrogenase family protein [Bacteroidota bacterium]